MSNPSSEVEMSDPNKNNAKAQEANGKGHPVDNINIKMSKLRITKNLLVVSFGFLFLFTSFQSLSNLQSSLHRDAGLGTVGLAVVYAALVFSCMFLPTFIIDYIGCKWTVAFSMLSYILYIVANFYATWATIIPSAVILGLGAAPLWSAKCTYLTEIGAWYAKMTGYSEDDVINRFFGIFFMIFQTSQIWGNLISSLVLSKKSNATERVSDEVLQTCGPNDCPSCENWPLCSAEPSNETTTSTSDGPPMSQVYIMTGIYTAFAFLAFLTIAVFLDKIVLDKHDGKDKKRKLSPHLLLETIKHVWRNPYQKMLIPLTMYSGIEQAFIAGDFTRSYITCSLGIGNIGYIMICYGVVDALCSFMFGRLVQFVGHIPFFCLAFIVHLACQITMLLWLPDPDKLYVFYILAGLWGVGDAVIQTQINAYYGYLFTDKPEPAFANYRLWESLGFIMAFGYSSFQCTETKLIIAICFLSVGMVGYGMTEFVHRKNSSRSLDISK